MPKINVYLAEDLFEAIRAAGVSVSPVCQDALTEELKRMEAIERLKSEMGDIEVSLEDQDGSCRDRVFRGRWLVSPSPDETRAEGDAWDRGAYYGVALTGRGRIAVYADHVNGRFPPVLNDYDNLAAAEIPDNIRQMAAEELGQKYAVRLDI